jgi:hypothetical protein
LWSARTVRRELLWGLTGRLLKESERWCLIKTN